MATFYIVQSCYCLAAALTSADGTLSFKAKDSKTTKNHSDGVVHDKRVAQMKTFVNGV
jgi:hypothetical protein